MLSDTRQTGNLKKDYADFYITQCFIREGGVVQEKSPAVDEQWTVKDNLFDITSDASLTATLTLHLTDSLDESIFFVTEETCCLEDFLSMPAERLSFDPLLSSRFMVDTSKGMIQTGAKEKDFFAVIEKLRCLKADHVILKDHAMGLLAHAHQRNRLPILAEVLGQCARKSLDISNNRWNNSYLEPVDFANFIDAIYQQNPSLTLLVNSPEIQLESSRQQITHSIFCIKEKARQRGASWQLISGTDAKHELVINALYQSKGC